MTITETRQIRAVIAEDEALFRGLLASYLQHHSIEIVAQAGDPVELMKAVRAARPDLAIIDIKLPPGLGTEGIMAAKQIRQDFPGVGIMLMSKHVTTQYLTSLLTSEQGGIGYWLKESTGKPEEFRDALQRVLDGECVLDPQVVEAMLVKPQARTMLDELTPRQLEVLRLMAEGFTNKEIMARLHIIEQTLGAHIGAIYTRFNLGGKDVSYVRRVKACLIYLQTFGRLNGGQTDTAL